MNCCNGNLDLLRRFFVLTEVATNTLVAYFGQSTAYCVAQVDQVSIVEDHRCRVVHVFALQLPQFLTFVHQII